MTAVGELVLVLGLLVSTRCEVRARDPGVEEEELVERAGARGGGGGGGEVFPPLLERLHLRPKETPQLGERGNHPARIGNCCAFVQKRVVTMAVACGIEKYTIKSQGPCRSGSPDCEVVMYKLSTVPVYRQKQQVLTSLQWRCFPGHGGHNCEDTVSDALLESRSLPTIGGSETAGTELHAPGVQEHLKHRVDPNSEQNDHHMPGGDRTDEPDSQRNATHHARDPGHAHSPHPTPHHNANTYDDPRHQDHRQQDHQHQDPRHQDHHHQDPRHQDPRHQDPRHQGRPMLVGEADAVATLQNPEVVATLLAPHMMALVMSELHPVLVGFNRSLEHLSRQVGDLARDVAQLKSSQLGTEVQAGPMDSPEFDEAVEERLDAKLEEVFHQMREVRRQMASQKMDVEHKLHSQHAMLHYNLTNFKTDIDMKLKRHQKMLQVSLQAMNTTLAELKLDQDQLAEERLEDQHPPPQQQGPPPPPPASDTSALWEAIERLDNMVVNNTVTVGGLSEDVEVTSGSVQQLRHDLKHLEKQINQTARTSQIQFMETGLEVEAAKEVVLRRVGEMAGNLSQHVERLQELDVDVDYLYTVLYKQNSSGDCDCKVLKASVARLEEGVANVTELANENRLALDENNEGGAVQWGEASDWETAVESLQHGLQLVKESLASEQTRTRTLDHSLNQLSSSVKVSLAEVSSLKEADRKVAEEMQRLSGSFNSLLKDVIRHSDVLELLLGEEVLEFLEWPVQDQEAQSIPALKEQLGHLQERLTEHNLSITSLLDKKPGGREEVPSADQPSSSHLLLDDWLPGSMKKSSGEVPARERQLLLHPDGRHHGGDGSDLWNLEKRVEELGLKVLLLEEKHHNTSKEREAPPAGVDAKLQAEVTWLKRGLEEHLRVFKNVFSNADVLAGSDATLELDKLWQLVKSKDGRKEKKKRGGNHRNRRESSGVAPDPSSPSDDPSPPVATSPLSVSNGVIVLEASLNQGQFYSGAFTAPVNGIYLFVLSLDLRPGPAHVVLRRGSGAAPVSLHRREAAVAGPVTGVSLLPLSEGEEVRLELMGGAWAESRDNVFAALLLHQTT